MCVCVTLLTSDVCTHIHIHSNTHIHRYSTSIQYYFVCVNVCVHVCIKDAPNMPE